MDIIHVTSDTVKTWAVLCNELWPHNSIDEMLDEFARGEYNDEYLLRIDGEFAAFISLSIRNDYVEGKKDSNPVGYLEAIYVRAQYRKNGIARELIDFAKKWSIERGCTMLASDCELSNEGSRLFHNKIGFTETNINVHFTLDLTENTP